MKTDTLSFRLFLFTSLWMVVSLAIVAILVSQDYRRTVENQFEDLITANLYNLMGSITRTDDGNLVGLPRLGDPRYRQFRSGWYWSVSALPDNTVKLSSGSLAGLKLPTTDSVEYDTNFQRAYRLKDTLGNNLMTLEAQVFLGEGDNLYAFRTTGNLAVLDAGIAQFRQRLVLLLGIFGIGLIATSFAIVRFGLKPLRLATSQLAQIRNGKAQSIEGNYPREIMPLIDETNALIKSNQAIVERSRTQVGNLAHSLKTPLSVMSLEVKNLPKSTGESFKMQLTAMNQQVQTYMNRAMISARHGAITSRTDVNKSMSRMIRTFNKLFADISFEYMEPDEGISFAGEQQDFEEIVGNILENAGNHAKSVVTIDISQKNSSTICIEISDDGPGLTDEEMSYVIKRGNRLDESRPGTGLGLSIVSDILKEYGANLELGTAQTGGLKVSIELPAT